MAVQINSMNANGQWTDQQSTYKLSGSFNADAEMNLQSVNGNVMKGELQAAYFDAYKSGDTFCYNFRDVVSVEELTAIGEAAAASVAGVQAALKDQ